MGKEKDMGEYSSISKKAEEFIDHREITDTLRWARENKKNLELVNEILNRAADCRGLSTGKPPCFLSAAIRKYRRGYSAWPEK